MIETPKCHTEIPSKPKSHGSLIITLILIIFIGGAFFALKNQTATTWLWEASSGGKWLLPLLSAAALVDSINPCAFSVLLLTIAFLFSIGQLRKRILEIGAAYILGIFAIYVLIGLGIIQTLHLFNTPHFMAKVGASLLIALGAINIINEYFPRFPIKLKIPESAHGKMAQLMDRGSAPAALTLGAFVGLCEFPCTGGPYLMVLGLLHDSQTYAKGFLYLLLYNLIFVLPLIVILLLASRPQVLEKVQQWQQNEKNTMRLLGGVAMIALGLIIFWL